MRIEEDICQDIHIDDGETQPTETRAPSAIKLSDDDLSSVQELTELQTQSQSATLISTTARPTLVSKPRSTVLTKPSEVADEVQSLNFTDTVVLPDTECATKPSSAATPVPTARRSILTEPSLVCDEVPAENCTETMVLPATNCEPSCEASLEFVNEH